MVSPASKTKPVAVTPASVKPPARDVPATASKDSSLFLTGSLDQFNNDGSLTVPGTSDLQLQGTAVPTAPVPPAP